MNKKILVPVKRNDRVENLIPYVENVAQPGMTVVFMMPYLVDGLRWSSEEFGRKAIDEGKKLACCYTWSANVENAKERIAPALKVLPLKGVEVTVDLYAGSLRNAVNAYMANGGVHLIVTRAGIGGWVTELVDGTGSIFNWFKRPSFSPVMLINPRALV